MKLGYSADAWQPRDKTKKGNGGRNRVKEPPMLQPIPYPGTKGTNFGATGQRQTVAQAKSHCAPTQRKKRKNRNGTVGHR